MNYEIVWGDRALDDVAEILHQGILDCFEEEMARLAANPTIRGTRSDYPYPGTQEFEFACSGSSGWFSFVAFFYFKQNERDINDDGTIFLPQRNRGLSCMLVDSEVQHRWFAAVAVSRRICLLGRSAGLKLKPKLVC